MDSIYFLAESSSIRHLNLPPFWASSVGVLLLSALLLANWAGHLWKRALSLLLCGWVGFQLLLALTALTLAGGGKTSFSAHLLTRLDAENTRSNHLGNELKVEKFGEIKLISFKMGRKRARDVEKWKKDPTDKYMEDDLDWEVDEGKLPYDYSLGLERRVGLDDLRRIREGSTTVRAGHGAATSDSRNDRRESRREFRFRTPSPGDRKYSSPGDFHPNPFYGSQSRSRSGGREARGYGPREPNPRYYEYEDRRRHRDLRERISERRYRSPTPRGRGTSPTPSSNHSTPRRQAHGEDTRDEQFFGEDRRMTPIYDRYRRPRSKSPGRRRSSVQPRAPLGHFESPDPGRKRGRRDSSSRASPPSKYANFEEMEVRAHAGNRRDSGGGHHERQYRSQCPQPQVFHTPRMEGIVNHGNRPVPAANPADSDLAELQYENFMAENRHLEEPMKQSWDSEPDHPWRRHGRRTTKPPQAAEESFYKVRQVNSQGKPNLVKIPLYDPPEKEPLSEKAKSKAEIRQKMLEEGRERLQYNIDNCAEFQRNRFLEEADYDDDWPKPYEPPYEVPYLPEHFHRVREKSKALYNPKFPGMRQLDGSISSDSRVKFEAMKPFNLTLHEYDFAYTNLDELKCCLRLAKTDQTAWVGRNCVSNEAGILKDANEALNYILEPDCFFIGPYFQYFRDLNEIDHLNVFRKKAICRAQFREIWRLFLIYNGYSLAAIFILLAPWYYMVLKNKMLEIERVVTEPDVKAKAFVNFVYWTKKCAKSMKDLKGETPFLNHNMVAIFDIAKMKPGGCPEFMTSTLNLYKMVEDKLKEEGQGYNIDELVEKCKNVLVKVEALDKRISLASVPVNLIPTETPGNEPEVNPIESGDGEEEGEGSETHGDATVSEQDPIPIDVEHNEENTEELIFPWRDYNTFVDANQEVKGKMSNQEKIAYVLALGEFRRRKNLCPGARAPGLVYKQVNRQIMVVGPQETLVPVTDRIAREGEPFPNTWIPDKEDKIEEYLFKEGNWADSGAFKKAQTKCKDANVHGRYFYVPKDEHNRVLQEANRECDYEYCQTRMSAVVTQEDCVDWNMAEPFKFTVKMLKKHLSQDFDSWWRYDYEYAKTQKQFIYGKITSNCSDGRYSDSWEILRRSGVGCQFFRNVYSSRIVSFDIEGIPKKKTGQMDELTHGEYENKCNMSQIRITSLNGICCTIVVNFSGRETLGAPLPLEIRNILTDQTIFKLGVGIQGDVARLYKAIRLTVRSWVEIGNLLKFMFDFDKRQVGKLDLAELLKLMLNSHAAKKFDWTRVMVKRANDESKDSIDLKAYNLLDDRGPFSALGKCVLDYCEQAKIPDDVDIMILMQFTCARLTELEWQKFQDPLVRDPKPDGPHGAATGPRVPHPICRATNGLRSDREAWRVMMAINQTHQPDIYMCSDNIFNDSLHDRAEVEDFLEDEYEQMPKVTKDAYDKAALRWNDPGIGAEPPHPCEYCARCHSQKECPELYGCYYPLCRDTREHATATCASLINRCETCDMIGHQPEDHENAFSVIELRVIHNLFWAEHPQLYYLMEPFSSKAVRKINKKAEIIPSLFGF